MDRKPRCFEYRYPHLQVLARGLGALLIVAGLLPLLTIPSVSGGQALFLGVLGVAITVLGIDMFRSGRCHFSVRDEQVHIVNT